MFIFLEDGNVKIFIHKNRKLARGLPIKVLYYKFDDLNEAVKSIDLLFQDINKTTDLVKDSLEFHQGLFCSRETGFIYRKEKRKTKKLKVREAEYYLSVSKFNGDKIKVDSNTLKAVIL